ncbi:MAG: hypothetical protein WBA88_02645 [Pseudaminobacter sp.]
MLLSLRDQDEEIFAKADAQVSARIAASTDPIEALGFINARGFSLSHAGRTDAATNVLREAASLALKQPPSKERDEKIVSIVDSMLEIPDLMPEAVELARRIEFPDRRLDALSYIARAYTKISDIDAANGPYEEIMAHLMDPPETPDWRALLSVRMALRHDKRENEVGRLIQRLEPGQGPGDPWNADPKEAKRFLDNLKSIKRDLVIARGAFPLPDTPVEPRWLRGPISLMVWEMVRSGQFELAEQYFQSWTSTKDEEDHVTYYANIAQARLTRGEYDHVLPAIKAMFQNALKEQAVRDASNRRPLGIAPVLADVVAHKQELGLDESSAKTLQSAACVTLNRPMRWAVPALRNAPSEWVDTFDDKPAEVVRPSLEGLFRYNCKDVWLNWIADPRLAEHASEGLVNALAELRRRETQQRKQPL